MRVLISFSVLLVVNVCLAQEQAALLKEQAAFESHWLKIYRGLSGSLNEMAKLKAMPALPFFAFDSSFRVLAKLDTTKVSDYFHMQTTQRRPVLYRTYGILSFTLAGKNYQMPIYQSQQSVLGGASELFFPFMDRTNGRDTYAGGRYIEMPIPSGTLFILDFNKSFNPYCVYSSRYSCELVPDENRFDMEIRAGIKN